MIASHDGPLPQAAHVVLPACAWAETEGTYVNAKGLAQVSEKALKPLGDAQPAWKLVADLGKALGFATSLEEARGPPRLDPRRRAPEAARRRSSH